MSNEDVEIKLIRKIYNIHHFDMVELISERKAGTFYPTFTYSISVTNKSNRTIYIDKGNCFKILADGTSFCFYDTSEQTTVGHGSGIGASVGLGSIAGALGIGGVIGTLAGGIAVGGGSNNTISTTYSQQRVIAIPPQGNVNLTNFKQIEEYPWKIVEHVEYFSTKTNGKPMKRGIVKRGQLLTYDNNNSPWKRKYILTYSTDSNLKNYSTLNIDLFLHQLIGTQYSAWGGSRTCKSHIKSRKET